jgi:hypothetical protein
VIREDVGRLILSCDRCPARLDLGVARAVRARNRTPSGWIRTGHDTHYCPLCSPNVSMGSLFAAAAAMRPQPLL